MKHSVHCSLKGLRNSPIWRKNLRGFFEHNGKELSDAQVRALVELGIKKGYDTEADLTDEDINLILSV